MPPWNLPAVPCEECGRPPADHEGEAHQYHGVMHGRVEVHVYMDAPAAKPVRRERYPERPPRAPSIDGEPVFVAQHERGHLLCPDCGSDLGRIPKMGQLVRRTVTLACASCAWQCADLSRVVVVPNDVSPLTG